MNLEKRAVVALVNYDGKILLGKKIDGAEGFLSGKWHILGETLENGETEEEGLKRGIMEEAGIEIKVLRYLASHRTPKHTLVKWYECKPLTYEIRAGSDLNEVRWVSKKEVIEMCHGKAKMLWPKQIQKYFR
ncbi:NUDIX domain-containing protein [Candidatus Woesearchaeota archaeon]|nr:NUDIX domain-containing protein [Candidatus Woesearchaeota archaeon]